jgi:hypothetical protein
MGTENVHVETIHKLLRRNYGDEHASEKSFLYGKSINNQRIESLIEMLPVPVAENKSEIFLGLNMLRHGNHLQ